MQCESKSTASLCRIKKATCSGSLFLCVHTSVNQRFYTDKLKITMNKGLGTRGRLCSRHKKGCPMKGSPLQRTTFITCLVDALEQQ